MEQVCTCTLAPLIVYAAFLCHNCAPNACEAGAVETKTSATFDIVQCEGIIITHTLNAYMPEVQKHGIIHYTR